MKTKFRILVALSALFGLFTAVAISQAAVEQVNIWTLSPNPQLVNGTLTTDISFSINDADTTHRFCIEGPSHAADTDTNFHTSFPASILLTGSQGFSSEIVTFNRQDLTTSQTDCAGGDTDAYVVLYSGTATLPTSVNTTYNTVTGSDINLSGANATADTGNWLLVVEEATGSPDALTTSVELIDAPDTIYASDSPTCLGLGIAGVSCFQALNTAEDEAVAAGADTLVIVGDLTVDASTEATTVDTSITTLRGTNSGRILATNCTDENILSVGGTDQPIAISDLEIDGSACTGRATGISTGGSPTINNITISGFSSGDGIRFIGGSSSGTISYSEFSNNRIGIHVNGLARTLNIGTSASDGNTLTNNTTGIDIQSNNVSIKGNTITGGNQGISLSLTIVGPMVGNTVTGASGNQINCNGSATTGAAGNYLGGISPTSGSDCGDVAQQIGSAISGWVEGSAFGDVSVTGATGDVFIYQLADDPYTYGEGMSDLAGFYAVYSENDNGTVVHGGSGGTQAKMPFDATGCAPMTPDCWGGAGDTRAVSVAQTGSGYYALGNTDPAAVTLSGSGISTDNSIIVVVAVMTLLLSATGFYLFNRKEA